MNKSIATMVFVVGTLLVQCCNANPYDECVKRNAEIIGQIEISDELEALVEEARFYYSKKACHQIEYKMDTTSDCNEDGDYAGLMADVFKVSSKAKDVIEAYYACTSGPLAGARMKEDGVFRFFRRG